MSLLRWLHRSRVAERRTRVLGEALAPLLPEGAQVLDVGCGDGAVAAQIARLRPDLTLRGIDVHVRDTTAIPVEAFDGRRIAAAEDSYDVIVLVDVLHHARDPVALLREAARVSRRWLVLKDHTCESRFAARRLAWMDRVGNPPGGAQGLAGISVRTEMAIAPTDTSRLFAAVERPRGVADLYMSIDAGETWTEMNTWSDSGGTVTVDATVAMPAVSTVQSSDLVMSSR